MICTTIIDVLRWRSWSSSNFLLMMLMAGSLDTDVKRAETSYYTMFSLACRVIPFNCWTKSPVFLMGVLMLLLNLRLGVIFWLIHLRVNLLWFLKLAIFFSSCSHFLTMATLSTPNSVPINTCKLLILFDIIYMAQWSNFLNKQNKFLIIIFYYNTSFCPIFNKGFLRCMDKCQCT